ncbi:MAG TPA: ribonuclease III [Candidatus Magasanikbacteria bacterium]|nr:ribonuclease III [Candidatus Magasanikbacteria bacterium]
MNIIPEYKEKDFSSLEKKLNLKFKNKQYLVQAFVHRSFLNENREFSLRHNERLEFLGDAVLELVVTKYLFERFLNPEGELTNWRAALVNAKMCSSVASELGLENYLFLSHGEAKDSGTKAREVILANAIEALIGAIYIDLGWDKAEEFVLNYIVTKLPEVLELNLWIDPKSRFQESAQEIVGITPSYKVLSEAGPDHNKNFLVGVYLDKEKVAEGTGTSKQEAQVDAAEKALQVKGWKGKKVEILTQEADVTYFG